jgi:hypothetical protein
MDNTTLKRRIDEVNDNDSIDNVEQGNNKMVKVDDVDHVTAVLKVSNFLEYFKEKAKKERFYINAESFFKHTYLFNILKITHVFLNDARHLKLSDISIWKMEFVIRQYEEDIYKSLVAKRVTEPHLEKAADALDLHIKNTTQEKDVFSFLCKNKSWIAKDVFDEVQARRIDRGFTSNGLFIANSRKYNISYLRVNNVYGSLNIMLQLVIYAIPRELASDYVKIADFIRTYEESLGNKPLYITNVSIYDDDSNLLDTALLQFDIEYNTPVVKKGTPEWHEYEEYTITKI